MFNTTNEHMKFEWMLLKNYSLCTRPSLETTTNNVQYIENKEKGEQVEKACLLDLR